MSKTGLKSNDKGWIQKFQLTVTEFIQSLGEDGAVQKKYGEIADSWNEVGAPEELKRK